MVARLIFLHGLASSGQSFKARLLRSQLPGILTPDFMGTLEERMAQMRSILGRKAGWVIIGSSLGGLMGALFTSQHPDQVRKLILLAPALVSSEFAKHTPHSISVPTVIFHGAQDATIPLGSVRSLAARMFQDLVFNVVDDDHQLYKTVRAIDWPSLVADGEAEGIAHVGP